MLREFGFDLVEPPLVRVEQQVPEAVDEPEVARPVRQRRRDPLGALAAAAAKHGSELLGPPGTLP
jgi:hypothetical protein